MKLRHLLLVTVGIWQIGCSLDQGQSGSELSCHIGSEGDGFCKESLGQEFFCGPQSVCTKPTGTDAGSPNQSIDAAVSPSGPLRAFVTPPIYTGSFALGLGEPTAEADRLCQVYADANELGGQWVAWLSSEASTAPSRLRGEGPWLSLDEEQSELFSNRASLEAGPQRLTWRTASGGFANSQCNWTGTNARGDREQSCENWSQGTTNDLGMAGSTARSLQSWTANQDEFCNRSCGFYCFETN